MPSNIRRTISDHKTMLALKSQMKIVSDFSYFELNMTLNSVNISEIRCHCIDAKN
jgi:hypothetical protein